MMIDLMPNIQNYNGWLNNLMYIVPKLTPFIPDICHKTAEGAN